MNKISPIHTIDCRDNGMFKIVQKMYSLTDARMLVEIQGFLALLMDQLLKLGVNYSELRTVLVPSQDRKEVAFIFDRQKIEDGWYGAEVFKRIVPLLKDDTNHSVLTGDYLASGADPDLLKKYFMEQVEPFSDIDYVSSNQFYIVYLNNITESNMEHMCEGLREWDACVGYADMTYGSTLKSLFSHCLVNTLIKFGKIVIQSSCGGDAESGINTQGYCFDKYGYIFKCIEDDMYDVFLSYKIERPVFKGFEDDITFALNSVTSNLIPLVDMKIDVKGAKLEYLKQHKTGSLERAGLLEITTDELEDLVKEKIGSNYIYGLDRNVYPDDEGGEKEVVKFNIMLEFKGPEKLTRLMASLEYNYKNKVLQLITLF